MTTAKIPARLEKVRANIPHRTKIEINKECSAWADWHRLSDEEKEETVDGYETIFRSGFDAACAELLPQLEKLVEALQEIDKTDLDTNVESFGVAQKAIYEYRAWLEGK